MGMIVEVRLCDIEAASLDRKNAFRCPIARAVCRRYGFALGDVEVDGDQIKNDSTSEKYDLPLIAEQFVEDFDNGKDVLPVLFEAFNVERD